MGESRSTEASKTIKKNIETEKFKPYKCPKTIIPTYYQK